MPASAPTSLCATLSLNEERLRLHQERVERRVKQLRSWLDQTLPASPEPSTLVLELGCGHGHFLTAHATANPDLCCLGVDFCAERIRRAERKRSRSGVRNLHFVRAEFREFLRALPEGLRFARFFALFPDPWPKKRHAKHRLMSPAFLEDLGHFAEPGAELYFRTDSETYFKGARAVVAVHGSWSLAKEQAWPFPCATVFQEKSRSHQSLRAIRTG